MYVELAKHQAPYDFGKLHEDLAVYPDKRRMYIYDACCLCVYAYMYVCMYVRMYVCMYVVCVVCILV